MQKLAARVGLSGDTGELFFLLEWRRMSPAVGQCRAELQLFQMKEKREYAASQEQHAGQSPSDAETEGGILSPFSPPTGPPLPLKGKEIAQLDQSISNSGGSRIPALKNRERQPQLQRGVWGETPEQGFIHCTKLGA